MKFFSKSTLALAMLFALGAVQNTFCAQAASPKEQAEFNALNDQYVKLSDVNAKVGAQEIPNFLAKLRALRNANDPKVKSLMPTILANFADEIAELRVLKTLILADPVLKGELRGTVEDWLIGGLDTPVNNNFTMAWFATGKAQQGGANNLAVLQQLKKLGAKVNTPAGAVTPLAVAQAFKANPAQYPTQQKNIDQVIAILQ